MNLSNNKILITGGGSGIGLGFTEKFLELSNTVLICGRRRDVLDKVSAKYPSVITRVCDLSVAQERMDLFSWVAKEHPDLNMLVNNAGIQQRMDLFDDDFYEKAFQEITINAIAPVHLISLFIQLPNLKTILNVTSGLAFVPLTATPVYCATKSFLHSFTLSAQLLLKAKEIEVVEIIPPALNTDLGGVGVHDSAPPVRDFIASAFNQLKDDKSQITFGFSEAMLKAGPAELRAAFSRMNGG